ncbi:DUF1294 domain-containing protein [Jeotgalibacillus terrae]|uniref:DUF1294 domain-containing protein n=1 Tax=Jeotgalibacillus terrae TaxID=587735 RepID=A0ABW5ZJ94_9BACL|nr:DUF1294 domain-containing protein [Jeotgalibacillus terrae]MBM7578899.1 uncharacterized membrane protein YsdA (DUF1294 family) [Jeotgalibacillus terrae]
MDTLFILFYLIMTAAGFISMRNDKKRAQKNEYRIAEKTLWTIAIAGGSMGSWVAMSVYRHKTKHTSFRIGMPFIVILHSALIIWVTS